MIENNINNSLRWENHISYTIALLSWSTGMIGIFHNTKLLLEIGLLSFLFYYILVMVSIGFPITFMEMAISQYSLKSVVKCWNICPLFKGIGYGKVMLIIIFQIYHNAHNGVILFHCFCTFPVDGNITLSSPLANDSQKVYKSPNDTELVLDLPDWKLMISFCCHMVLVTIFNSKSIYILESILPWCFNVSILQFIILFFITNTTPGGLEGIKYILIQKFSNFKIWNEQEILLRVFRTYLYSIGLSFGVISNIAAQGCFRKSVYAMSLWTNLANLFTSFFYGLLFANLYGILQHNTKVDIDDFLRNDSTRIDYDQVFGAIPKALIYLPGLPQTWKFIFYSSIYLRGLCASSLMIATILNVLYEENTKLLNHKQLCNHLICILTIITGWTFYTKTGFFVFQFINNVTINILLPLIATLQVIAVIIVYGLFKFINDVYFMLGSYPSIYWIISFNTSVIVTPVLTCISIVQYLYNTTLNDFEVILLKIILSLVLGWIPFMAMVRVIRKTKLKLILNSAKDWGPGIQLEESRKLFDKQHSVEEFLYEKYLLERKLKKYE